MSRSSRFTWGDDDIVLEAEDAAKAFDPDQERDESGKWTSGGGGESGATPVVPSRVPPPGGRKADLGRERTYEAERDLGRTRVGKEEAQGRADEITSSETWKELSRLNGTSVRQVRVGSTDRRMGSQIVSYTLPEAGKIFLAKRDMTVETLLHEMAHVVSGPDELHSARFRTNFLSLVRHHMGRAQFEGLRKSFDERDLPHGFRGA